MKKQESPAFLTRLVAIPGFILPYEILADLMAISPSPIA
jgi:hypothetical protein